MKQLLLFILSALSFTSVQSQTYYMCSGTASSSANYGTLYDSGGPTGNYSYYEDCEFLIKTACPANGNITITFSSFSTEQGYDYLTVYNGSTTASPVLGSYWGTGALPPMVATSGFMLVTFHSDGSSNLSGFVANWSFANPNCSPVANFNMNVNACQGKVIYTDASTYAPTSWIWNFGDGNASTLPSPVHTYTAPGTYSTTLIVSNTLGTSTITKSLTVNPITFSVGYNGSPLLNSALSFTTDNTTGQVYTWTFGDGALAGTANAIHSYTAMGTYTAALTIASGSCITTSTLLVVIKDAVGVAEYQGLPYNASVYPNPFTSETQVNIQLAKDADLKIELLNQLGEVIKVMTNEKLQAGEHSYVLSDLSAGVYYVTIKHGDSLKTMKLIALH